MFDMNFILKMLRPCNTPLESSQETWLSWTTHEKKSQRHSSLETLEEHWKVGVKDQVVTKHVYSNIMCVGTI